MITTVYEGHTNVTCRKNGHLTSNVWSWNYHGRMLIVECAICGRVETWDAS